MQGRKGSGKKPVSRLGRRLFGTMARQTLDARIGPVLRERARGRVLEVGARASPYREYIDAERYEVLDYLDREGVDHVADLHATGLPDDAFDTVVATEVFEHLYHPHWAADEVRRILKPGGWLIGSTRFSYPYHDQPHDYFRFTIHGLRYVLREFEEVEVIPLGNTLTAMLDLLTTRSRAWKPLRLLGLLVSTRKIRPDSRNPSGFIFSARKGW